MSDNLADVQRFNYVCPTGSFIAGVGGTVDTYEEGSILSAVGPILCSDNAGASTAVWGDGSGQRVWQNMSAGIATVSLVYEPGSGISQLVFDGLGGSSSATIGDAWGDGKADIVCPEGSVLAGLSGSFIPNLPYVFTLAARCLTGAFVCRRHPAIYRIVRHKSRLRPAL